MSINKYGLILFLLFLFAFSLSVYGQEEDSAKYQTDEIIVTGTRLEQKIIDIPYPVSRINQNNWIISRKMGVQDVLLTIPGLFLQPRYGNHDTRITIRGYGSRSNTGIRGVRILLDGIAESEPDGQTRLEAIDFDAIGRIEVVRGYSSSLYANAPGGVINFLTDKFFPVSFIQLNNEFGSYDLRKNGIKIGVNGKNSRFMTTYSYQNYKGYRQHSQEYENRLNSLLEVDFTPVSKLSAYGYYVRGLIKLPGSLTLTQYNENDTVANSKSLSRDEKRISEKGRVGVTLLTSLEKGSMKHTLEATGYGTIKIFERAARTYRLFTRYGIGATFRYVNKFKFSGKIPSKQRTNEFTIGTDLFYQDGPIREFINYSGEKGEFKFAYNEIINNIGVYALNTFDIFPQKLSLLISGRYDRVVFDFQNEIAQEKDTSRVFADFTPKAALNFKLTPHISLYTSVGYGFDSPAGNEMENFIYTSDSNYHTINPDIKPQKSTSFEIGIKGELEGINKKYFMNTFFELTFYKTKIEDVIVPFVVDNTAYFRNAAVSNRTGIEFGFNTEVIKGLTLKGSYAFQNFKYDQYIAGIIDSTFTLIYKDYAGNYEPSNPRNFFTGEAQYQYILKKKYTFYLKSNIQYVGEMFVNDANTDNLKTDAYTLVNAQIGFDLNFNKFRLIAYGGMNNLFDKKYVAFININSDANFDYYEAGLRRNFFGGLTLAYIFR
ncbi:MAG TPA: TonB-dependent receptor [Ignavibacteria bacterium]|nr:TonB-dependent receptor [Ignavibacteria bacterium]